MKTFTFVSLFLAFLLVVPMARGQEKLKIGALLCLTGDCAEWGNNSLKAVQLAVEQLNAERGILGKQIELVVQDSADTAPRQTVSAFQKLAQDKEISFIVGPTWTVGAMPIAPLIAKRHDLVVMSPSVGLADFNEAAANIFNDWPHDEVATRALARYARNKGWSRAAVFGSQNPFCEVQTRIFAEEFRSLGGEVVATVEPLPDSRELKIEALKIKSSNPDFVMLTHYQYDVIAKDFRGLQFDAPLLALLMEKDRVKAAEGALEGAVFALYEEPRKDFAESFSKKFGVEPGITADTAYDAVMLYAAAAEKAGSVDAVKIKDALLNVRNFVGASGKFSIDDKGAVDKKPVLWRVKGLGYERVDR